jgi:hypothetical protein
VTLFRRGDETSLEDEREALRRQRAEGAAEIDRLKRALAERVEFVRMRERELEQALERAGKAGAGKFRLPHGASSGQGDPVLEARAAELSRREAALQARERQLAETAAAPTAKTAELDARERAIAEQEADLERRIEAFRAEDPAEREARIETRLAELKDAEVQFVRTQAELASRSDRLAEREQELAARERALPGGNGGDTVDRISPVDVEAIEARLRRLEQSSTRRGTSFSAGVRAMQQRSRSHGEPEAPLH